MNDLSKSIRESLIEIVNSSKTVYNYKNRLKYFISELSEKEIFKLFLILNENSQYGLKDYIKIGVATGIFLLPGGLVILAVLRQLYNAYNYKCQSDCLKTSSISDRRCYHKCNIKSLEIICKRIKEELEYCKFSDNQKKCYKKGYKQLIYWTNRLNKARDHYELWLYKQKIKGKK